LHARGAHVYHKRSIDLDPGSTKATLRPSASTMIMKYSGLHAALRLAPVVCVTASPPSPSSLLTRSRGGTDRRCPCLSERMTLRVQGSLALPPGWNHGAGS